MLQELFETILVPGGTAAVYYLLGGWSQWLQARPVARLFIAMFIVVVTWTAIMAAIE